MYFRHLTKDDYTNWQHPLPLWLRQRSELPVYSKPLTFWARMMLWIKSK